VVLFECLNTAMANYNRRGYTLKKWHCHVGKNKKATYIQALVPVPPPVPLPAPHADASPPHALVSPAPKHPAGCANAPPVPGHPPYSLSPPTPHAWLHFHLLRALCVRGIAWKVMSHQTRQLGGLAGGSFAGVVQWLLPCLCVSNRHIAVDRLGRQSNTSALGMALKHGLVQALHVLVTH